MTPPPAEENDSSQQQQQATRRSPSDYIFGKVLGEGSFSTVYLAKDIHTNKEYAIKVLEKKHIKREKKVEYVTREKEVLKILSPVSNYIVRLYCTFQDANRLYFVLSYAKNGELLHYIQKNGFLSFESARFYAAEMVLAIEALRSKGIIHRDLKPENILFDENMHILLTDFGSAKILNPEDQIKFNKEEGEDGRGLRRNSFVGTAQYVSPEVLTDNAVTYSSDLWALGCNIYQMISGMPPFRAGSEYLIFQKILKLEYEFPDGFNEIAMDLVNKLLVLDAKQRLGATDEAPYASIRAHPMFEGVNWNSLGVPPPVIPFINSEDKTDSSPEFSIPNNMEPGLDNQKVSRLHLGMIGPSINPTTPNKKNLADLDPEEVERRLETQRQDRWHSLVSGNLILKQGLVDKKKGLFSRKRMLLLTLGPHLYYVDPSTMVLKGEIPWGPELRPEAKNFKTFFVHTPNRTYYLEDPEGYALEWCNAIEQVHRHIFPSSTSTTTNS